MDTNRSGVRAGSVWESRMQSDDVKNGILKVFDIEITDKNNEHKGGVDEENKKSREEAALPEDGGAAVTGKRRTWRSGGTDKKSPVQIGRGRADPCEDQCRRTPPKLARRRSNVLFQAKKSPFQSDKVRSEAVTPERRSKSGFNEAKEKSSPVLAKKARSESIEVNERTPARVRKTRSELCNEIVKSDEFDSGPLRKVNSSPAENFEESKKQPEPREASDRPEDDKDELVEERQQNPDEVKEFGVCQEKIDSIGATNNSNADEQNDNGGEDKDEEEEAEEDEEEVDEEIEVEKKSIDVKEVNVIKHTNNRVVDGIKRFNQFHDRRGPCASAVRKVPPPVVKRATSVYSVPLYPTCSEEEDQSFPRSRSKLQSLVDLVMWRDVSRSALVFGMGTFLIISSSYAKDLNFSFISVVAYVGLVYLGASFVLRSVIHRGEENNKGGVVVREEEVIWMVRLILPYLNDFLLNLTAFFSGDPATTIKMGVVLFVLARCGSSITIWKMAKLGFFGAFTVPRIFTSYSTYLSAYAEFWMRRFRDAWESCTHKKAVALALFILVWNLSSVVARVWAAFMLFVALRYYQQTIMNGDGWTEEEEEEEEEEEKHAEEEQPKVVKTSTVLRKQTLPFSPSSNRVILPNKLKKLS